MASFAFASANDLVARHDARTIRQLATDDPEKPLAEGAELTDANVQTALEDASAQIQAALISYGKYEIDDLENVQDRARQLLVKITCIIAMANMFERRPRFNPDQADGYYEQAQKILERLQNGDNMLNLTDKTQPVTPTVDGPTSVDLTNMNRFPERMLRFFPAPTGQNLPLDRG